jgi:hypothetical protein
MIPICMLNSFEVLAPTGAAHGRGDTFAVAEDRRARHEHVGAGANDERSGVRVDAAVHFHIAPGLPPLHDLADPRDLRKGGVDEVLMAEPRVDGHHQHLVDVADDLLQHRRRRRRVDDDPGALAQAPDPLHRAVQVVVALPVDEERVRTRLGELVQEEVRVRDHAVGLQGQVRHPPERLHGHGSHREVRDEVPVHDVHVDPVGPGLLRRLHLFAQASEVGG